MTEECARSPRFRGVCSILQDRPIGYSFHPFSSSISVQILDCLRSEQPVLAHLEARLVEAVLRLDSPDFSLNVENGSQAL